jgi:sec-independent protein translocase protein TatC
MALVPFPGPQTSAALQRSPEDDEDSQIDSGGKMSFLEHLDELRKRLMHATIGVVVGVIVGLFFHQAIYDFIFEPTKLVLPPESQLIYTQPGEAFSLHIQIALIAGVVLAAPYVMFQVWRFIAPGLYANEKKFAIPFVALSSLGLLGGAAFSHYVAFPFMIRFFGTFDSPDLRFMPALSPVWSMYIKFLLAMAITFQMPTVVFFLARMRVVTARFLVRHFKYAVLIIFVLAAIVTPSPDPGTQAVFAAPMLLLYLFSIAIAWIVSPRSSEKGD